MLHITNGDCAANAIRESRIPGHVLPWRDVLHEGPVPADLTLDELRLVRARFLSDADFGILDDVIAGLAQRDLQLRSFIRYPEVVLWFEHDLYDQLQLIQLLDYFSGEELGRTALSFICVDEYLGTATSDRLRALFLERRPVATQQLELGHRAWAAFRCPNPNAIVALLEQDLSALPFVAGALVRHLEQFPSTTNGLSRSEQQALQAIDAGSNLLEGAFVSSQSHEERTLLGDSTFASYLEGLSNVPIPLVLLQDGRPVRAPRTPENGRAFWKQRVSLTDTGRAVLAKAADWVQINGVDRWLGGVYLSGDRAEWRWSPIARRLEPTA